jgi:hypothetical protein
MNCIARCVVVAGLLTALTLAGCASSAGVRGRPLVWTQPHAASESLGESPDEHYHRVSSVVTHDARALVDDLDLFFMTDRTSRLTRWHSR